MYYVYMYRVLHSNFFSSSFIYAFFFFRKDTFKVLCGTYLGRLTKIRIGHDNSGLGPGWFLNKASLIFSKEEFFFSKGKCFWCPWMRSSWSNVITFLMLLTCFSGYCWRSQDRRCCWFPMPAVVCQKWRWWSDFTWTDQSRWQRWWYSNW